MGVHGPIPKRSAERMGHRSKAEKSDVTKASGAEKVPVPKANSEWHPLAKRWYASLAKSGQSRFYEPSDWAFAFSLADDLSYYKARRKRSSQMLTAVLSGMDRLLTTEGDRRRVRMELDRGEPEVDASVVVLDDYRAAFAR